MTQPAQTTAGEGHTPTLTPPATPQETAAAIWAHDNWHAGKEIAGADSGYVAYWAHLAGQAHATDQQKLQALREALAIHETAIKEAVILEEQATAAFHGPDAEPSASQRTLAALQGTIAGRLDRAGLKVVSDQPCTENAAHVARIAELERALNALINAGDNIAEHFNPGPIPAESPTQADMDRGNWEYFRNEAKAALSTRQGGSP